jgi:hypothetical protein
MSDAHAGDVPTTRSHAARPTPLFDYGWVPFWAFSPFVYALYWKGWLLPGEDLLWVPLGFWFAMFVFVAGMFGTLFHLVVVRSERVRVVKIATVCGVLGAGSTWSIMQIDRPGHVSLLVDVRFALADIPREATSYEFIQGGVLGGTGAWLKALAYDDAGRATARHREREYVLQPFASWEDMNGRGFTPRFSCPAYDGWFYVFWWDT